MRKLRRMAICDVFSVLVPLRQLAVDGSTRNLAPIGKDVVQGVSNRCTTADYTRHMPIGAAKDTTSITVKTFRNQPGPITLITAVIRAIPRHPTACNAEDGEFESAQTCTATKWWDVNKPGMKESPLGCQYNQERPTPCHSHYGRIVHRIGRSTPLGVY